MRTAPESTTWKVQPIFCSQAVLPGQTRHSSEEGQASVWNRWALMSGRSLLACSLGFSRAPVPHVAICHSTGTLTDCRAWYLLLSIATVPPHLSMPDSCHPNEFGHKESAHNPWATRNLRTVLGQGRHNPTPVPSLQLHTSHRARTDSRKVPNRHAVMVTYRSPCSREGGIHACYG